MPAGRRQRHDKALHQKRFLAAFSVCASVLKAARWAKIDRTRHYDWLEEDPDYAARFEQSRRRALGALEDEMIRRAHEGVRKPVWYKGKIVGHETEYSDRMLELALKGNHPEKFREKLAIRDEAPAQTGNVNITMIVQIILEELATAPQETRTRLAQRLMALDEAVR